MKKNIRIIGIFVLLLSTVTLLSSCKKDVKNLPGTWRVSSAVVDGDEENDLKDVWTFNDGGSCRIQCDMDEYFDHTGYDVLTFDGHYVTDGNKTLTITGNKFGYDGLETNQVVYSLDILTLTKKKMMVSGTVTYYEYLEGVTNTQTADVAITLTK